MRAYFLLLLAGLIIILNRNVLFCLDAVAFWVDLVDDRSGFLYMFLFLSVLVYQHCCEAVS